MKIGAVRQSADNSVRKDKGRYFRCEIKIQIYHQQIRPNIEEVFLHEIFYPTKLINTKPIMPCSIVKYYPLFDLILDS